MAGKKRTRSGEIKAHNASPEPVEEAPTTNPTPPCAQPQLPSSASTKSQAPASTHPAAATPNSQPTHKQPSPPAAKQAPSKASTALHKKRQKLPRLPSNAVISKRPLLHPAIPTPFASAQAPKVLYITATTPYISCIKRVRKLLSEIARRAKQSLATHAKRPRSPAEANGRLAANAVEREIAEEAARAKDASAKGGELVYLKATGRAIPRALEVGVHFQGEQDCWVRVEMGSVCAVDDIEVKSGEGREGDEEQDVPETRIRTLSSVTVSIGLK